MTNNLAVKVSRAARSDVTGVFQRHSSTKVGSLIGSPAGGRWGPPDSFPVLYLGKPIDSVVAEAYRHLVDGIEGMSGDMVAPRTLWTCQVTVTNILDLRDEESRDSVGLTVEDLMGPTGEYGKCQQIAQAANQLQLHGIIAPAATGIGETLALFEHHLPPGELPIVLRKEIWQCLPADPRQLRVAR